MGREAALGVPKAAIGRKGAPFPAEEEEGEEEALEGDEKEGGLGLMETLLALSTSEEMRNGSLADWPLWCEMILRGSPSSSLLWLMRADMDLEGRESGRARKRTFLSSSAAAKGGGLG